MLKFRSKVQSQTHKIYKSFSNSENLCRRQTKKDAMTSGCLDRKEVRCATWRVQCEDQPAGGNTGRLFLTFGGPVYADRFSILSIG